jgi:hypothetical protein
MEIRVTRVTEPFLRDKSMTKVQQWLAASQITDNPAGDLIADMRSDQQLPDFFRSRSQMENYLMRRGACQAALDVVPEVWRRYRNWVDR